MRKFLQLLVTVAWSLALTKPYHWPSVPPADRPVSIYGKTPCCVDRLTTIACTRLASSRKRYFEQACQNNPDFAFVQCCATCFHRNKPNSAINYDLTAKKLLLNPFGSQCADRRGSKWCQKMMARQGFWGNTKGTMSCQLFPFAFRECRHSCGLCTIGQNVSKLRYDYSIATNPERCSVKTYYAKTLEKVATTRMPTTTTKRSFPIVSEVVTSTEATTEATTEGTTSPEAEGTTKTETAIIRSRPVITLTLRPEYNNSTSYPWPTPQIEDIQATVTEFDPLEGLELESRRVGKEDYFVADLQEELLDDFDLRSEQ